MDDKIQRAFKEYIAASPDTVQAPAPATRGQFNSYDMSAMWPQMVKEKPAQESPTNMTTSSTAHQSVSPSSAKPSPSLITVHFPPPPQSRSSTSTLTPSEEKRKMPAEPLLSKIEPGVLSPITKPYFPYKPASSNIAANGTLVVEDPHTQPLYPEITYITDSGGNMMAVEDYVWNRFLKGNVYKQGSIDPGPMQGIMTDAEAKVIAQMATSDLFEGNIAEPGSLPVPLQKSSYPTVVGGNLFNHIADLKVQSFFRHILLQIATGQQKRYTYHWFCDSPELERKMSMTVNRLAQGADDKFVLWSSKIIHEQPLSCQAPYLNAPASADSPHTVCSFCKRILVSRKEIAPQALEIVDQWVKDNWTDVTQPLIDANAGVPVFGLRGKQGQHWEESKDVGHVWMTPTQYYGLGNQVPDVSESTINHGCCALCYRECAQALFPQFLMNNRS
jgi:hypothetical protein